MTGKGDVARSSVSRAMTLSSAMTHPALDTEHLSKSYERVESAHIAQSQDYQQRCEALYNEFQRLRFLITAFEEKPGRYVDPSTGKCSIRRFSAESQVEQLLFFGEVPCWIPVRQATRDLREAQKASWLAVSSQYRAWLNATDDLRRTLQSGGSAFSPSERQNLQTLIKTDARRREEVLERWRPIWGTTCGPDKAGWAPYVYTNMTIEEVPPDREGNLPRNELAFRVHVDTYLGWG